MMFLIYLLSFKFVGDFKRNIPLLSITLLKYFQEGFMVFLNLMGL